MGRKVWSFDIEVFPPDSPEYHSFFIGFRLCRSVFDIRICNVLFTIYETVWGTSTASNEAIAMKRAEAIQAGII